VLADFDEILNWKFKNGRGLVHNGLSELLDHLVLTAFNEMFAVKLDSI
jgi:hypothetical protein